MKFLLKIFTIVEYVVGIILDILLVIVLGLFVLIFAWVILNIIG